MRSYFIPVAATVLFSSVFLAKKKKGGGGLKIPKFGATSRLAGTKALDWQSHLFWRGSEI